MAKTHHITIKNLGDNKWYKPTYTQHNVLKVGDIIEATYDGFDGKSKNTVIIMDRSDRACSSLPRDMCVECPFHINHIGIGGTEWPECTARRNTGKGIRNICNKGISHDRVFRFKDLDHVLEDL